jgi:hypothetical protein
LRQGAKDSSLPSLLQACAENALQFVSWLVEDEQLAGVFPWHWKTYSNITQPYGIGLEDMPRCRSAYTVSVFFESRETWQGGSMILRPEWPPNNKCHIWLQTHLAFVRQGLADLVRAMNPNNTLQGGPLGPVKSTCDAPFHSNYSFCKWY